MPKLYTVGHSNRTLEEFIAILKQHEITLLIDVRTLPQSRHVPWFNKNSFREVLKKQRIKYLHMKNLGGLRSPKKDSINTSWRNSGFRGFADYMQTDEFYFALKELNQLIKKNKKVVIMCAEAVPWRCHRSLIADAEIARGVKVFDIMNQTTLHEHELTSFAVVNKNKKPIQVFYP